MDDAVTRERSLCQGEDFGRAIVMVKADRSGGVDLYGGFLVTALCTIGNVE